MPSHGVISQGSTLRGPVAVALRLCPIQGLRSWAELKLGPSAISLQTAGSSTKQPGPEMPPLRTPGCLQTPLHRHSRAQRLTGRLAQRAHAPRQAQSSCWPTGRRVQPGVTAATPLTLAAASHWPAGPSLGHACWHSRARPRARQAHIHVRECLGQQ